MLARAAHLFALWTRGVPVVMVSPLAPSEVGARVPGEIREGSFRLRLPPSASLRLGTRLRVLTLRATVSRSDGGGAVVAGTIRASAWWWVAVVGGVAAFALLSLTSAPRGWVLIWLLATPATMVVQSATIFAEERAILAEVRAAIV